MGHRDRVTRPETDLFHALTRQARRGLPPLHPGAFQARRDPSPWSSPGPGVPGSLVLLRGHRRPLTTALRMAPALTQCGATPYTPAGRRLRGRCAPQLPRPLCRAGCVWGGCVPKAVARVRIAERRAGSAERAAGTRKRRCCFSLSSLTQRAGTHRFAAPPGRIWTAPQWRPLVSSTGPGDPKVSSGKAAPSRRRPRGGGPATSRTSPRAPAARTAPSGRRTRWALAAAAARPAVLWSPRPGARRPGPAGALLADAGLLPAAWLPTQSCPGGRRAPVARWLHRRRQDLRAAFGPGPGTERWRLSLPRAPAAFRACSPRPWWAGELVSPSSATC